jgi:hypothetical protein
LCLNSFIVPIPAEEDSKIDRHDLEADNISININPTGSIGSAWPNSSHGLTETRKSWHNINPQMDAT